MTNADYNMKICAIHSFWQGVLLFIGYTCYNSNDFFTKMSDFADRFFDWIKLQIVQIGFLQF